jgi:hypothetical protein
MVFEELLKAVEGPGAQYLATNSVKGSLVMNSLPSGSCTTTTRVRWGQRLMQSVGGMLGGILLILLALGGLWWNEGRAIQAAKGLSEGAAAVLAVSSERADAAHNGRLVHLHGQAVSGDVLADDLLGIEATAIALVREVEMYQWREERRSETRSNTGGSQERVITYHYKPEWSARHIDSSQFNQPGHYRNPAVFPVEGQTRRAENVAVGDFRLNSALIAQIGNAESLALGPEQVEALPERFRERATADYPGWLYVGDPILPQVGDLRIRMAVVRDQPVSVLARQVDNTFEPFTTSRGTTIQRLMSGQLSAEAMLDQMQRENTILTWGIRIAGLLMTIIGFSLVLKPIQVMFDVLPILGSITGAGVGLVSGLLGGVLSLLTIALAWLFHRPLLSLALLAACGVLSWLARTGIRARKTAQPDQVVTEADLPDSSSNQ